MFLFLPIFLFSSCKDKHEAIILDPYFIAVTSIFTDIKKIAKDNDYDIAVLKGTEKKFTKMIENHKRPTIVSPLLGKRLQDNEWQASDNFWLLNTNNTPYAVNYIDMKILHLYKGMKGLVFYYDPQDAAFLVRQGGLEGDVLWYKLVNGVDYNFLIKRYKMQNVSYVFLLQRDFPVDIDRIIVEQGLNSGVYITDRPSLTNLPYFLLEQDYDTMFKNFKNEGKKEMVYHFYNLNAEK